MGYKLVFRICFHLYTDGSNLGPGSSVIGTIDAKFDSGYIVTVNLGSEQLKGVIYHTPTESQMSQNSNNTAAPRRRSRNRFGDPSWFEESSSSGYSYFYAENYNRLQPMYDRQEKVMNKKIWLLWSRLTEAEKQVPHTISLIFSPISFLVSVSHCEEREVH